MKRTPRHLSRRSIRFPMIGSAEQVQESGEIRRLLSTLLLLAGIVFPCLVLYQLANPVEYLTVHSGGGAVRIGETAVSLAKLPEIEGNVWDTENVTLERILEEAAMEDKTVILTTLNEAWATPDSIMDLFLYSFRIGFKTRRLMEHLVIVALDQKAYARCLSLHTHCFALQSEGDDFSGEKSFMTSDYLKMMWRRIDFLRSVLELGYNFVFTDADIMWFRDPFPVFNSDADFQIACDHFFGTPTDLQNRPNGGFKFVKSNNRTISFYKFWHKSRETHPGYHDQDVLNFIKYDPFISEIGLQMRFLNTDYFGGFCEPSKDFNKVCTMHANCCVGLGSKIHDLSIMLEDWRRFMSLPPSQKSSSFWSIPRNCSVP
ncbi:uncharacterized protein At4g15970 [Aristolochia californica]|uniref:uncharacterized protein At4g15970 n=1 Tax=Aristolochia californica TaxID=171875 RepID=UPI0035DECB2D